MEKMNAKDQERVNGKLEEIKNGRFTDHDKSTVLEHSEEIIAKGSKGPLGKFFDDIKTMCAMVKAWSKKEYKGVPVRTISMTILTLVYVFSPVDIIPDFIPGVGLLDDAAMVAGCVAAIRGDLEDFRKWHRCRT